MSKRFIDTEMFNDEWFSELTKDTKLFFIYYITSCDHAGVLRLNRKLCEFQTGIKSLDTVIKELGNCLVTVKDSVYFMPKFIKFQYPNFPQSTVKQQFSAIKILKELGFWNNETNSYLTVSKELANTYVNDNDTVIDTVTINIEFEIFWNLYNKKVGSKEKLKTKWEKLKDEQRQKIIDTLPTFLNGIKDKQFQPHPETYLNNERWEDELEIVTSQSRHDFLLNAGKM